MPTLYLDDQNHAEVKMFRLSHHGKVAQKCIYRAAAILPPPSGLCFSETSKWGYIIFENTAVVKTVSDGFRLPEPVAKFCFLKPVSGFQNRMQFFHQTSFWFAEPVAFFPQTSCRFPETVAKYFLQIGFRSWLHCKFRGCF